MDRIESQVNALIRAIQSDERYLRYQTCRKSLENYPELMERIFSLRRDVINYNRMTENPSLIELGAQFGERYEELREKVSALENKTRELSSCLSTWGQIASAPMEMERVSEYIIGRPSFDNYVVKETPLADLLEDPRFKPKGPDGFMAKLGITLDKWKDWLFHSKDKTVLYIGRHRDKRSIGIKLDSIRIARDGDKIALYGANITVLDPIKLEPDTDSVSHCWVLNNDKGKTPSVSINTADIYSAIPELYAQRCREEAQAGFDKQFELQCQKKTETLRNLLSEYVPGVVFYDSIDDTSAPWVSLRDCFNDKTLYPVLSSINLICDLLSDSGNNGR